MKRETRPDKPGSGQAKLLAGGGTEATYQGPRQALASIRPSMLPYMLIFSLAPIFPNFKNSMAAYSNGVFNLDGMFVMGIGFSLGISLVSLVVHPQRLAFFARVLSILTAALFLGWMLTPKFGFNPWLGLLFSLGLGGCAGTALFGFTYVLNDMERLAGAALTVLFCIISQIVLSFQPLSAVSGPVYLGAQVAVTMVCFQFFKPEAYLESVSAAKEYNSKTMSVAFYFFLAHRAVVFFFSYLPRIHQPVLNGLAGIALLALCLVIFFAFRFNTWYMCAFFFIGMLISAAEQLIFHDSGSLLVFDILQGFGYMGYIASYYLLGYALSRHVDYKRFRLIILVIFNISLLFHLIPATFIRRAPEAMLLVGTVLTLVLFVIFVMLAPVFSQMMFHKKSVRFEDASLRLMQEKGFTGREQEITWLLLEGKLIKECADALGVSEHTVKFHAKNIYRKLNISGRSEL